VLPVLILDHTSPVIAPAPDAAAAHNVTCGLVSILHGGTVKRNTYILRKQLLSVVLSAV